MSIQRWIVSGQKLYTVDDQTPPATSAVFIVGTDFYFGQSLADYTSEISGIGFSRQYMWSNVTIKNRRVAAGNAVYMWGNYFGSGESPANGGQLVLDRFNENSGLEYFTVNMNLWDLKDDSPGYPRGSHSYSGWLSGSGHWIYVPNYDTTNDETNNSAATDDQYSAAYEDFPPPANRWYTNNTYYGTRSWHTNWLNRIKTGSPSHYENMFGWYLMDEPFNSNMDGNGHRDYVSNEKSVSGHFDFCSYVEGTNERPKIVNGFQNTSTDFTRIQGVLSEANIGGIYMGNNYQTSATYCWTTPNMVKWCKNQIQDTSSNMIMAWAPGWASEIMSYYFFYGSIIEGARGILWWMNSGDYTNYMNYGNLTGLYSSFKNPRFSSWSDENVILSGTPVTSTNWDTNPTYDLPDFQYNRYGTNLSNCYSAAVFKWYSGNQWYFRAFIVKHKHDEITNVPFDLEITDGNWGAGWDTLHSNGDGGAIGLSGTHITGSWGINHYYCIVEPYN